MTATVRADLAAACAAPGRAGLRQAQGEPAFAWPVRVYWEDTDAGGIVFYANYLKFFERARTEWLRSLGIGQRSLRESTGGMFVVGETSVRYHRPARLDDELLVTARVRETGRASLIIAQQVFLRDDTAAPDAGGPPHEVEPMPGGGTAAAAAAAGPGGLICEGTIRIGWVEAASLKPARIPPTILETLKQ